MKKNLTIRNSTAEFLIFTTANGQDTIEVKVEDEKKGTGTIKFFSPVISRWLFLGIFL